MTTPAINSWTVNADGSVTFFGYVDWPAGTNLASGAGIMMFGPNGGTTNLSAIWQGPPGMTATMTFTQVQVAYGTSLPSTNPAVVFTPASGDTPPNYALTIYVNAGEPGATADTILGATDLVGTPAAGSYIGYNAGTSAPTWYQLPVGGWYYAGSVSATASNTNAIKPMTSIAVPAQTFAWWPKVEGFGNVVGAVDTRVDLVARVNSTSGEICGYGMGAAGASPPPLSIGACGLAAGSPNIIAAGSAATIFFNAENQTSSANPWNTTSTAFFQVKPDPVPA